MAAISILTIIIQFAAVGVAVSSIRRTRRRWMWLAIAAFILGLAAARTVTLVRVLGGDLQTEPSLLGETVFLVLWLLMLAGLVGVRSLCISFHQSVQRLDVSQESLRAASERLQSIIEHAPIVFWAVDKRGELTFSAGRGLSVLGLETGELVGQSAFELRKSYPLVASMTRSALAGEELVGTVDIVDLSYEVHYVPIKDERDNVMGVYGVAADISKRRGSERQLRATKERFKSLVETTSDWVWELDSDCVYTYASPKVAELLGYGPNEVIGRTPSDLIASGEPEDFAARCREIIAKKKPFANLETISAHKDGRVVELETSGVPVLDAKEEFIGYRGITRDVTKRKQAEKAQTELADQLRHSQKLETIGTMAGGIAHDFNNILTPILGYADLALEAAPEKGTIRADLEEVIKATNRAKDLVKQILVFSRRVDREFSPLQIHLVIREALKLVRASLPATIEIKQNVNSDAGTILANSSHIHQLFMNLCTNAAHAMPDSGGVLEITLCRENIDGTTASMPPELKPGSYARLTVRDTGKGMDPDIIDRIFEPFFTTKDVGRGSGLGLSVVHGIVKDHGGEIAVKSESDKGTVVDVYFPHVDEDTATQQLKHQIDIHGDERVLFVDDEPQLSEVGKRVLGKLGYDVTTASDGAEALELLRSRPEAFDVVVTDQTMPRMTGLDLAKEIRESSLDIPVIITTGFSDVVTEDELRGLGIYGPVMKPLVGPTLGGVIRQTLSRHARR